MRAVPLMTRYWRSAPLVDPIAVHGERDPRIAPDVAELALVGEGADDDLAILEPDPGRAHVGSAVIVNRHERRNRGRLR